MKFIILILALSMASFSIAQENEDINECSLATNTPLKSVLLPGTPSWFISAHPDGESAGVILDGHNYQISMNELDEDGNPKIIKVPGQVDPVFTPDGWFLTQPGEGRFYDSEEINQNLSDMVDSSRMELLGDNSIDNVYQSIGVLDTNNTTKATYMYIGDPNPITGNDLEFSIMKAKRKRWSKKKVVKEVKTGILCQGIQAHTPMISTDGKYLSIINDATMTTQIFRVDDEGRCDLMVDLGVPTGKVTFDFNTNPRKISFHVDRHNTTIDWFSNIDDNMSKDTYVMDIDIEGMDTPDEKWKVSTMQRLSNHLEPGTGLYYPRFTKEGKIIALRDDGDENYYLELFDVDNGTNFPHEKDLLIDLSKEQYDCTSPEFQKFSSIYALASLYQRVCEDSVESLRMRDAILLAATMSKEECQKLVEDNYSSTFVSSLDTSELARNNPYRENSFSDQKRYAIGRITKEDVLSACPNTKRNDVDVDTDNVDNEQGEQTPEKAFRRNCTGCHLDSEASGGYQFINAVGEFIPGNDYANGLNADSAWKSIYSLLNPDAIHVMPPNGHTMSKEDLEGTAEFLKGYLNSESKKRAVDRMLEKKIREDY